MHSLLAAAAAAAAADVVAASVAVQLLTDYRLHVLCHALLLQPEHISNTTHNHHIVAHMRHPTDKNYKQSRCLGYVLLTAASSIAKCSSLRNKA
jgi:hypothetical protein